MVAVALRHSGRAARGEKRGQGGETAWRRRPAGLARPRGRQGRRRGVAIVPVRHSSSAACNTHTGEKRG